MSQKQLGETKVTILESCITPKSWSDLVKVTDKTEPTLMVHLNDLQDKALMSKTADGYYLTTEEGMRVVELTPSSRAPIPQKKMGIEPANILLAGLGKKYDLSEKIAAQFPRLVLKGYAKKSLGAFVNAIGEAVRASVVVWLPTKVEIDKHLFEEINHIVAQMIKQKAAISDGKLRIIIDVDFPKALDKRIRSEADPAVKETLIQNRERIIKDIVDSWDGLFDPR